MEEVYAYLIGKKETGLQEKTLAKLTVSAVLLVAAVLVLSGISKRGDLIYETPRFARGLQNGTYSAQKENQFSTVRVDMTITDDRIEDCRITSSGPADLMTDEIRSAWANAIVEGQDPAPEAITGATLVFSAGSVQEAVQDILAQAAGEKEPEVLPEIEAPAADPAHAGQEQSSVQSQDGSASVLTPSQAGPAEPDPDRPLLQDGTYSARKENQFSTVLVDMTIADGRIEDCRITSSGPADLMTDEIRSAWANAIVEGQDPAPEAITGATLVFSAASVQEALRDILAQAAVQEQTATQPQDGSAPDTEPEASSQAVLAEPDPDRLMRERPAVTAQPAGADRAAGGAVADPAAKQVSETETGDSERMMRERPAEAPAEPEAAEPSAEADDLPEAEPEVNTAEAGDPERLMRERPAEAPAEPEAAEPSAEADALPDAETEEDPVQAGDPERLMRARPDWTAVEPAGEPSFGTETAEEPSVTEEVLRLMRRRP